MRYYRAATGLRCAGEYAPQPFEMLHNINKDGQG
jgi:hypothetical protein